MSTETISQAISQARQTPKPDDDALSRIVATSFPPAGSQYSPAGINFSPWDEMELRLVNVRRELALTRQREIEARGRAELLERTLADVYERQRFQHSVSAGLAVALVLAIFALLA